MEENKKSVLTEIEKAKKLIEAEKKERGEKAKAALDKWAKEFNVQLGANVMLGNQPVPVNQILSLPVSITFIVL